MFKICVVININNFRELLRNNDKIGENK